MYGKYTILSKNGSFQSLSAPNLQAIPSTLHPPGIWNKHFIMDGNGDFQPFRM